MALMVEQLRRAEAYSQKFWGSRLFGEAAAEIERMARENAEQKSRITDLQSELGEVRRSYWDERKKCCCNFSQSRYTGVRE